MDRLISYFYSLVIFTFLLTSSVHATKKTYIVYFGFGAHPSHGSTPSSVDLDYNHDFLASVLGSKEKAKEAMIYSYKYINGFAASLEDTEAANIAKRPEVVSVFLSKVYTLQVESTP